MENKNNIFQSFWSTIPTLLLEDKEIPIRAKKLYGLISSLCRKEGYCWASNKFLAEYSEIPIGTLRKYLKLLERKEWIKSEVSPEEGNQRRIFLILPDFSRGGMSTLTHNREHRGMSTLTHNREQRYVHAHTQPRADIYNNKDINNIDINNILAKQSFAGKEINDLIKKFESINPSYERLFGNTTQRAAMERLVKKWGEEKVSKMIGYLPKTNQMKYAPVITTPLMLENKLAQLIGFINREQIENESKKILKI